MVAPEIPAGCVLIPVGDAFALVDEADFPLVSGCRWKLEYGYARTFGKRRMMHHVVFGIPPRQMVVDHVNGNRLDNRRENLRLITRSANSHKRNKTPKSGYHGVYSSSTRTHNRGSRNYWQAAIQKNGTLHNLGSYSTAEEAARAYNQAAKALYGEHAMINEGI